MDMSAPTAIATTTTAAVSIPPTKSPEAESETPPRIQPSKPISFTNGVLKRHNHHHRHVPPGSGGGVTYKECLKNHAASLGGHALDGCGEFMQAPTATPSDPTSLKCAACGCHRNFHRREPEDLPPFVSPVIEYHPHHRHHPLPPPPAGQAAVAAAAQGAAGSPGSQSPPPISSSYYPGSAPHMLLALSSGTGTPAEANNHHLHHHHNNNHHNLNLMNSSSSANPSRKRFRTKFTQDQKDKMYKFAEKMGWKMQKSNEDMVNGFCSEIGVERGVFKVWMHNNKNTFGKRSANSGANGASNHTIEHENGNGNGNSHSTGSHNQEHDQHHLHQRQRFGSSESNAPTNASSSSS